MSVLSRNNVSVVGSGPSTIMFSHGFGCDQNMWRYVTPAFVETFVDTVLDGWRDAALSSELACTVLNDFIQAEAFTKLGEDVAQRLTHCLSNLLLRVSGAHLDLSDARRIITSLAKAASGDPGQFSLLIEQCA